MTFILERELADTEARSQEIAALLPETVRRFPGKEVGQSSRAVRTPRRDSETTKIVAANWTILAAVLSGSLSYFINYRVNAKVYCDPNY